jgi:hypothetical protein
MEELCFMALTLMAAATTAAEYSPVQSIWQKIGTKLFSESAAGPKQ